MPYNWKCCSLYPNNFGASALLNVHWLASTGQCTCFHWAVYVFPLASGNMCIAQWTLTTCG